MSTKFLRKIFLACLVIAFCMPIYKANGQDLDKLRLKINAINVEDAGDTLKFIVKSNKSLTYTSYLQENPWKLTVELAVVDLGNLVGEYNINKGVIKSYEVKQKGKTENYTGAIEINLSGKPTYNITRTDENSVVISINKSTTDSTKIEAEKRPSQNIIKNVLYSGETNKFIMILETTKKPEFLSYTLKNPTRIVFDITNAIYEGSTAQFSTQNPIVKGIRVESYPSMSRIFVDIGAEKLPIFIPKAENNRFIVEFVADENKEVEQKIVKLENIDFSPSKDKVTIRLKKVGSQDYRVLKLKDTILVFDINGVLVNKDIQKTYDTDEVNTLLKSFTLYQVKPLEDNKARFVVDLKGSFPYKSFKDGEDLVIEFFKESPITPSVEVKKKNGIKEETPAQPVVVQKKETPASVETPKKTETPAIKNLTPEKKVETVVSIKSKPEPVNEKGKIPSQYKGRPISVTLKDADIQHILKLLSDAAREDGEVLNIVASDDVKGKLSIQLEAVPWDQVLDLVLEVNNLGKKRIGNILRIMPKDKLRKEEEELLAASKTKEKLGTLELDIVNINFADATELLDKVKPLLSSRGTVTIDKRNNSLIINDLKEYIAEVKKLIAKLDTPPQQVIIEARVVEATSDFTREIGIQWGLRYAQNYNNQYRWGISGPGTRADTATNTVDILTGIGGSALINSTVPPAAYFVNLPAAIGQGVGGGINFALVNLKSGHALDIQLSALENKGIGKILSRPKITTINNVEANIQQGSSIPYETLSDKGTQTQFIDANLQLTVTPRITPDNSIILKVKVSNNNPNTSLRSARGVPSIDKNEATTEILVRDGQTIVIGGIIRSKETVSKSGIPFLMDIPILGWLFKKEAKSVENRELLIFLTPNIVKSITQVEAS